MLPAALTTNEVKNASGTEVEFEFKKEEGSERIYALKGENPSSPQRIHFRYQETGKEGTVGRRRRSNLHITVQKPSEVDGVTPCVGKFDGTLDVPIGHMTTNDLAKLLIAYANSLLATNGAGTSVLFDGTGTAAAALINGTL